MLKPFIGMFSIVFQLVQDFATIHRMTEYKQQSRNMVSRFGQYMDHWQKETQFIKYNNDVPLKVSFLGTPRWSFREGQKKTDGVTCFRVTEIGVRCWIRTFLGVSPKLRYKQRNHVTWDMGSLETMAIYPLSSQAPPSGPVMSRVQDSLASLATVSMEIRISTPPLHGPNAVHGLAAILREKHGRNGFWHCPKVGYIMTIMIISFIAISSWKSIGNPWN